MMDSQELMLIRRQDLWLRYMLQIFLRLELRFFDILSIHLRERCQVRSVLGYYHDEVNLEMCTFIVANEIVVLAVVIYRLRKDMHSSRWTAPPPSEKYH